MSKRGFLEGLIISQVILLEAESLEQARAELRYLRSCVEEKEAQRLIKEVKEEYMVLNTLQIT